MDAVPKPAVLLNTANGVKQRLPLILPHTKHKHTKNKMILKIDLIKRDVLVRKCI